MTMMMDAPVVIAYSCSEKKRSFFETLASAADFIPGLTVVPHESLGGTSHHALVHKRTDDFVASLTGDRVAAERFGDLHQMLPESVVPVDKLNGICTLVDRAAMARAITKALDSNPALSGHVRNLPWTTVHVDSARAELIEKFKEFDFPVIIKRRLACGTPESHMMAIAYDVQTAVEATETIFRLDAKPDEYSRTIFVQEFIPHHGGVLFKLYAIGDRVEVQARSSVQQSEITDENGDCIHFDSQELSKRFPDGLRPREAEQGSAPMPPADLSRHIATVMQSELDLSLIGVDLIFDVKEGKYSIVDINYFPGFKGVENANRSILLHAMEQVLEKRRLKVASAVYRAPVAQWARAMYSSCGDRHAGKLPSLLVIQQDVRNVRQIIGKGAY